MLSSELSQHMANIGKLGGERRKLNPNRFILAREAARISWSPESAAKRAATIAKRKHDQNLSKM